MHLPMPRQKLQCQQFRQATRCIYMCIAVLTQLQLSVPSGVTYSSGHSIPLKLTVQSEDAPALASLLIQGVEAQLAKHVVAWANGDQVVGRREITLSNANFITTDTSQEGLAVSYFELPLGESGKEQSWVVGGILEIAVSLLGCPAFSLSEAWLCQYLIRVLVRCPGGAANFVPTYRHVSRIGVSSEPWGTREHELRQFGGFSAPAIGLSDPRLELRPPSSVAW
jgi:hypothetical protein